jgi:hypothetical protein
VPGRKLDPSGENELGIASGLPSSLLLTPYNADFAEELVPNLQEYREFYLRRLSMPSQ